MLQVHGSTISRNQFVFIAGLAIFLVIGYCLLQNTQQTVHPVSCPTHETLAPRRQLQLTNGEVNVCDTPDGPPCDKNAKLSAFCTTPGIPCRYFDQYDFRIILITQKRAMSLAKVLHSLQQLEMDGDKGIVEIWVDAIGDNKYSKEVLSIVQTWRWQKGATRVHYWKRNVGIIGNWIDTYRPGPHCTNWVNCKEVAMILEDDVDLSPMAYRWIKATTRFFSNRTDLNGLTLSDVSPIIVRGKRSWERLKAPPKEPVFIYHEIGTWGYIPHPKVWRDFQTWFHDVTLDSWKKSNDYKPAKSNYKPYVPDIVPDGWYKSFEKQGTEHNMWEMWALHYHYITDTYTLYYNLRSMLHAENVGLSVNREVPGLHTGGGHPAGKNKDHLLLRHWEDRFIKFHANPPKYEYDGSLVNH